MKRWSSIAASLLAAVMMVGALASCDGSSVPGQTGEPSARTDMPSQSEKTEPVWDAPYRIDYQSVAGQEGKCIASLVLNPDWNEDFTVEIPEISQDGNIVIGFVHPRSNWYAWSVPSIISEKTYQEKIMKPLKEAAERGEIGSKAETDFYIEKFESFFWEGNPSKMHTEADVEACIKSYPITDPNGVNIPVRVFATEASLTEILLIQSFLDKYTSFSAEDIYAEYRYFQDEIRKANLNDETKKGLLEKYQYRENGHFTGLTFPDSLLWVSACDLLGYDQLMQTENGISYIGNWAVWVDDDLDHIAFREGTVGTAEAILGRSGIQSITVPASLKTICSSWGYYGNKIEIHISDVAAWTGIACTRYHSDSNRFEPDCRIDANYDLYLKDDLLTDVVIPDGVTSIDLHAFSRCTSIKSITIPDGVTSIDSGAFRGCKALTSITIPDSVTSIGDSAFFGCGSLESVTIPDSVTSLGEYVFSNCWNLTSITIPFIGATKDGTNNTHFGYIFGASSSSNHSNYVPSSLKTVVITGGTSIGANAFEDCSNLTSITIPDSVTSISSSAFNGCSRLTSIAIPDGVTSIGWRAFCYCSNLTSITIPDSVTRIDANAFDECTKLIQKENGVSYVDKWVIDCDTSATSVILRDGTVGIGSSAFSGCSNLRSITIPDSVTSIGDGVFCDCSNLERVTIPNGVTSIGSSAFRGCSGLTSITIPDGVTSIGEYVFSDCWNLTSITYQGSVEQWDAIVVSNIGWSGSVLCTDGTIVYYG